MASLYSKKIGTKDQVLPIITETERILPLLPHFNYSVFDNLRFAPKLIQSYQNSTKPLNSQTQTFLDFLLIFGLQRNNLINYFQEFDQIYNLINEKLQQTKKPLLNKNKKLLILIDGQIDLQIKKAGNLNKLLEQFETFTNSNLARLLIKKLFLAKFSIKSSIYSKANQYYLGYAKGNKIIFLNGISTSIYADEINEYLHTLDQVDIYIQLCVDQAKEFQALGDTDSAKNYFKTALIFDPDNPEVNYALGELNIKNNKLLAKEYLLKALKSNSLTLEKKAEALYLLGEGRSLIQILHKNKQLIKKDYYKLIGDTYYFFNAPDNYKDSIFYYESAINYYLEKSSNKSLSPSETDELIKIFIRLRSLYLRKSIPYYNPAKAAECHNNIILFSKAKKAR